MDALAVDDDVVALGRHLAGKLPVHAVVLEEPCVGLRVGKIVDAHQIETAVRTFQDGACDEPADPAESVDGDFGH